ncbi:MAG TPA: hypothetical protein VGY77_03915, partial [Gemmataceae bacterium]|nr:hypothetical protein [Gemmataceae bacterium]
MRRLLNFFHNGLLADRKLLVVLLVWALCWLGNTVLLKTFSTPLPWCDEWDLTPVACGAYPVTWEWIFEAANEHRAPLTRLEVLLLGRLFSWDLRLVHHINLALLAAGSLVLIFSVRAIRGQSALNDVFVCLLVLTPWQYQTVLIYCYGYAMALSILCVAVAATLTGWPLRSLRHLGAYFGLLLGIVLSAGPAGAVWAVGLCGIVVRGWLQRKPPSWKISGLAGTALITAISGCLLVSIPAVAQHDHFRSDTVRTFLEATAQLTVSWIGHPVALLWPWVFIVFLLPFLVLLAQMARLVRKKHTADDAADSHWKTWIDLTIPFAATLAVAAMIGYGRGHYPNLWESRYCTLLLPIALMCYLLLVRLRAPVVMANILVSVMVFSFGWNWPVTIGSGRVWHDPIAAAQGALKEGSFPLTIWATCHGDAVGCFQNKNRLVNYLVQLRTARLSIFKKGVHEPFPGIGLPITLEAEAGRITGNIRNCWDPKAAGDHALQAISLQDGPGTACYDVEVPATGTYELCCRIHAHLQNHVLIFQIDD